MFMDVQLIAFIGIGFLMTFLKRFIHVQPVSFHLFVHLSHHPPSFPHPLKSAFFTLIPPTLSKHFQSSKIVLKKNSSSSILKNTKLTPACQIRLQQCGHELLLRSLLHPVGHPSTRLHPLLRRFRPRKCHPC